MNLQTDVNALNAAVHKELRQMIDSQTGRFLKTSVIDGSPPLFPRDSGFSAMRTRTVEPQGAMGTPTPYKQRFEWILDQAVDEWWENWGSSVTYRFKQRYWSDEELVDILEWKKSQLKKWSVWLTDFTDRWKASNDPADSKALLREWDEWVDARGTEWYWWFDNQEKIWEKQRQDRILYEHAIWLKEMMVLDAGTLRWQKYAEMVERKKDEIDIANRLLLRREKDKVGINYAERLIQKSDLLKYICPALITASNDSFEVAKIITPIMIGLAVAGTIAIPVFPIVFASTAYVLTRAGISSLCRDYRGKPEK